MIETHLLPHLDTYKECRIAQTIISHPHVDHIAEVEKLQGGTGSSFYSSLHTCPHDKEGKNGVNERLDWNRVDNPKGSEEKIEIYKSLYAQRSLPLQTIQYESSHTTSARLEYGLYYVRPPKVTDIFPEDDQEYTNGTSLVLFFRYGQHTLLIPGDMPPEVMEHLLEEKTDCEKRFTIFDRQESQAHPDWYEKTSDQPSLKSCLQNYGLTILVASHHGLESGYSDALYEAMKGGKPGLIIISEKRHLSPQDGKVSSKYQSTEGACGMEVDIEGSVETRYSVSGLKITAPNKLGSPDSATCCGFSCFMAPCRGMLTTRNGHHLLVVFRGAGYYPKVYADKDPEKLLNKV